MLNRVLKELGFMGFRSGRFSKIEVVSPEDMNTMVIKIKGLTRVKKLSTKEIEYIKDYWPGTVHLYIERLVLGRTIWRKEI